MSKFLHILESGIDEKTRSSIEYFAKGLATTSGDIKPLSTSQLRKFFGAIKRMQVKGSINSTDFAVLEYQLAYAVGKDKKKNKEKKMVNQTKIAEFYEEVRPLIRELAKKQENNKEYFSKFIFFIEAVVAYHKYYEEEKN